MTLRCQITGKTVPNSLHERPILGPLGLFVYGTDVPLFLFFMPDNMSFKCFFVVVFFFLIILSFLVYILGEKETPLADFSF